MLQAANGTHYDVTQWEPRACKHLSKHTGALQELQEQWKSWIDVDSGPQGPQCCGWDETDSHGPPKSYGGKGTARPLSQGQSASTLAWTGFYWLSNIIHQRRFSFIMLRFALGNYFLLIAKERMFLITSYRLTRKKCCKCMGMVTVIGLVTLHP